jgi:hypothetical protein
MTMPGILPEEDFEVPLLAWASRAVPKLSLTMDTLWTSQQESTNETVLRKRRERSLLPLLHPAAPTETFAELRGSTGIITWH